MTPWEADYNKVVGRKLMRAVALRGASIRGLSRSTGIPERTIQDVLHGAHAATALNVAKLCTALELDANAVLGVRRAR